MALKDHLKNYAAHIHVAVSGTVGAAVAGAGNALQQTGLDASAMANYARNDWRHLRNSMLIGAGIGIYFRIRQSPYKKDNPPQGGNS